MRIGKALALAAACALLAGCANTVNKVAAEAPINWTAEKGKKVLLVDPDAARREVVQ